MQKIIFINRFFYPDHSATSQLLTDLVSKLNYNNCEIHIVTSRMKYDDENVRYESDAKYKGVYIHRCWTSSFGRSALLGRAIDYLTFYMSSFFKLLTLVSKNDVVVAKTDPPLISVSSGVVTKFKQATLINWVQDLFPEVAKELNVSLFNGILFNVVKYVRNWSLKIAYKNVVLGELMAEKINSEIKSAREPVIIPNWVVGKEMRPVSRGDNSLSLKWGLTNKFVIGYSGNLGRAHDYKTILKAAIELKEKEEIVFLFIGGGAGYDELKKQVETLGLSNFLFKQYQSTELLSYSLSVPDVHIISLEPALEGLIVPSKFYGIISVGKPIIFIGDQKGEIARLISKYNCGLSIIPGDAIAMKSSFLKLKEDSEYCNLLSKNSRDLYESHFAVEKSVDLWRQTIAPLLDE